MANRDIIVSPTLGIFAYKRKSFTRYLDFSLNIFIQGLQIACTYNRGATLLYILIPPAEKVSLSPYPTICVSLHLFDF